MKRQINFKKLARLKVVQIVEPSENMKIAYLEKAESSLLSSRILFKNKQFLDSLVLAYCDISSEVKPDKIVDLEKGLIIK